MYLNSSDVNLSSLSPEFLHILLERTSATLHHLNFDGCGISDSQLTAILLALGRCSQLTTFSFCGNPVSKAVLESQLQHTLLLSRFRLGVFPVPLECYLATQGTFYLGNLRGCRRPQSRAINGPSGVPSMQPEEALQKKEEKGPNTCNDTLGANHRRQSRSTWGAASIPRAKSPGYQSPPFRRSPVTSLQALSKAIYQDKAQDFFRSRFISMNSWSPLRLFDLANQSLLQDEDTAIAALESLPTELFPPLFMAAIAGRHIQTLKAIVQAWPFTCLPLGALLKAQEPHQDILKAALDGLDVLLAQKFLPRRWKQKVLDLHLKAHTSFWDVWSGTYDRVSSCSLKEPEAIQPRTKRRKLDDSRTVEKHPLAPMELLIDLCLKEAAPDEILTFLIKRVKQRTDLLHLCCRKLKIVATTLQNIEKILKMVQLDYVQELKVNCTWDLTTLARFAPYLGQMINLNRLCLSHVIMDSFIPQVVNEVEKLVAQFSSQLLSLHQLQKLHLASVLFLEGHLDQVLRCLKTPLETLIITNCLLLESDLAYLSLCPITSQLRYLNLSDVNLNVLSPEFLQILLERTSATLYHLNFDGCGITDSQLTTFSFCGNSVSKVVLEGLLRHTLPLSRFRLGVFPVPLECYLGIQGTLYLGYLQECLSELRMILQESGQPNLTLFSDSAWNYDIIYMK
ncbi:melanoma antigen preferentially expressed in tumors-like [Dugong dugon]